MAQALVEGLLTGGLVGLAAAGLTALWKISGLLNLAQGALMLLGSYICLELAVALSFGIWVGVVGATIAGALLGYLIQIGPLRLLAGGPGYLGLAGAYALGLVIKGVLTLLFGADYQSLPASISQLEVRIGTLALPVADLLAFAVAAAATLAIRWTLAATRLGLSLRALADDRDAARLIGLPAGRLIAIAGAMTAAAATLAGALLALTGPFDPAQTDHLVVLVCAAAAIGRLGNLAGAFLAAVVLGGAQSAVGYWAPPELADTLALVLLLGLAVVRSMRRDNAGGSCAVIAHGRRETT